MKLIPAQEKKTKEAPKETKEAPKEAAAPKDAAKEEKKKPSKVSRDSKRSSKSALAKFKSRESRRAIDQSFEDQFASGYLFAQVSSFYFLSFFTLHYDAQCIARLTPMLYN